MNFAKVSQMIQTLIKDHFLKIALLIFFALYLWMGLPHLAKFQTADEDLWIANPTEGRIHEYWRAIQYETWEDTRINDKPGVSTAIFGGMFGFPYDSEPEKKMFKDGNIIDKFNPEYFEKASFFYRIGIFVANGLLVLCIAWFVWAITHNRLLTFFSSMFLYLSPILLGVSQIINPDAMLWSFGFAASMGYLAFVVRGKWYFLLLAGIFFGFTLLSKYTGAFLFFILYLLTFSSFLYLGTHFETRNKFSWFVVSRLLGYAIFCLLGIGVFALLMPAAIVEPKYIYEGTFGFSGSSDMDGILQFMGIVFGIVLAESLLGRSYISYWLAKKLSFLKKLLPGIVFIVILGATLFSLFNWGFDNYFNLETAPFDAGKESEYRGIESQWNQIALQIKSFIFTLPPLVLFFTLLAFPLSLFLGKKFFPKKYDRDRLLLFLFVFGAFFVAFYYAAIEQRVLVHVRYSILLYPVAAFIAAITATFITQFLMKKCLSYSLAFIAVVFFISMSSLVADRPYYFNYTNDLLPQDQDVVGAWGYGGYEAAEYLNNLEFSEYFTVWADYEGFCPFFKGRCIKGSIVKWHQGGEFTGIDYFIVSRRGLIRNESSWEKINRWNRIEPEPVWTLYIGDRPGNFVEVYKARPLY